jgi:hypothetical protein
MRYAARGMTKVGAEVGYAESSYMAIIQRGRNNDYTLSILVSQISIIFQLRFVFESRIRVLLGLLIALTLVASAESWSSSSESIPSLLELTPQTTPHRSKTVCLGTVLCQRTSDLDQEMELCRMSTVG